MSNVVIGRMPFTLGIALAVGAWACARRSRAAAAVLSLASVWASPVAGVFLCVAALAVLAGARLRADAEPADWPTALALGLPAVIGGLTMTTLFPEGGSDHFVGTAFWPMLLVCLGALALVDPSRRTALWAAGIYVAILAAAFAIPNSLGQNALRPGVVLGPALLVLFARPRAPRAAIVVIAVALLYLQWLPAVRAVEEARGDPSTHKAFHAEVLDFLRDRAQPGERLEVPLTRNHWEATYLAQDYPLARGWHRQLDRKVNPLFYDHNLTADRYERWLRENAVRWVALPNAPLDFSATAERQLLLDGLPVPEAGARVGGLAHLGGAQPRAAGLGRGAHDRGRGRRVRPGGEQAGDGDRPPARDAVLDGRRRRRLRVRGPAPRAGRGSTCARPGWSACGRASRPPERSGGSRAAPTRRVVRMPPCARVRSAPLSGADDARLPCERDADAPQPLRGPLSPQGLARSAPADPAVLRRVLAVPVRARIHRRQGRAGVRQRPRADPHRAGTRPVHRAGGPRLGARLVGDHRRCQLDVPELALRGDHGRRSRSSTCAATRASTSSATCSWSRWGSRSCSMPPSRPRRRASCPSTASPTRSRSSPA